MSNQRPASIPEFKHTRNRDGAKYLNIDDKFAMHVDMQKIKRKLTGILENKSLFCFLKNTEKIMVSTIV